MDEQVKARLIGATVLVVVAVALVPELLSGPKHHDAGATGGDGKRGGTRTYTIDLSGAVASGARLQPSAPAPSAPTRDAPRLPTVEAPGAAAERGGDEIPPETDAAAPANVQPSATVATTEPLPPPPPAPAAAAPREQVAVVKSTPAETKPASTVKGGWSVQVGAFGSADSARKLVSDLKKDGLPAYLAPLSRNGKTLHRVRVGPEPSRADADKLAASLKRRGLPASVVAAD